MLKKVSGKKIKLEGFNNLTKNLSFNIYDVCYAKSKESQLQYLEYIDEEYNSEKLYTIVEEVTRIIDAKLVNVSLRTTNRGASVTALLNEYDPGAHTSPYIIIILIKVIIRIPIPSLIQKQVLLLAADIDVSTCGYFSSEHFIVVENFGSHIVLMVPRSWFHARQQIKIYIGMT